MVSEDRAQVRVVGGKGKGVTGSWPARPILDPAPWKPGVGPWLPGSSSHFPHLAMHFRVEPPHPSGEGSLETGGPWGQDQAAYSLCPPHSSAAPLQSRPILGPETKISFSLKSDSLQKYL